MELGIGGTEEGQWDCIKKGMSSRLREVILPLYFALLENPSGLVRKKDMYLLEGVQRRTTKLIIGLEDLSYDDRLFSLQKKRFQRDIIGVFQYLKGSYKKAAEGLFTGACNERKRGNYFKLEKGRFRLDIRKKFFEVRVVSHRNRLLREAVNATSLEVLKTRLDGALGNLV
ncbi:hypothetical protein HGM15179_015848 [Zosterops borbonicus]|uniref:Uncharacterized protein n=1 Tax=Zosterops borbonicus TaxID=364589 RepID=A0A8K1G4A3_9PASS|nr:hypothetical protein HGM15179_015848 [Zosterops borbonicus]